MTANTFVSAHGACNKYTFSVSSWKHIVCACVCVCVCVRACANACESACACA
jgi:hypothetical protein